MGTVRYTVIEGEVVSELRGGVKRDYVPDPLGSTVALLDNTQTITDTFQYWPYGESAARTGTTATPFQYVGTVGYFRDTVSRIYIRERILRVDVGRWLSANVSRLPSEERQGYTYASLSPTTFGAIKAKRCIDFLKNIPLPKHKEIGYCIKNCEKELEPKKFTLCIGICAGKWIGGKAVENAKNYACCLGNSTQKDKLGNPLQPCVGDIPESRACCNYHMCICVLNREPGFPTWADGLCPGRVWLDCQNKAQAACHLSDDEWTPGEK